MFGSVVRDALSMSRVRPALRAPTRLSSPTTARLAVPFLAPSRRFLHPESPDQAAPASAMAYADACVPLKDLPKSALDNLDQFDNEEIISLVRDGRVPLHHLEHRMSDLSRAVEIRRTLLLPAHGEADAEEVAAKYAGLPYSDYDWSRVLGANAENVVGYLTIPVGVVSNLMVNETLYNVPMSTTEGCLIASTQRGAKAIALSGGASAVVNARGMTRAPVIKFDSAKKASEFKQWIETPTNYALVEKAFNSTTRFGKLKSIKTNLAGRTAYVRFACDSGDAMGMNMVSKGTEKAMEVLREHFEDLDVLSIAGNFCTDKKPSAINWIEGRGRSVVADIIMPRKIVETVLRTTVYELVHLNTHKNLNGSIMAGSIGGFNAHASNIVTAIFLATGQDPAQNVESSNCLTFMEETTDGDLYMSVTMPSIEVGTVGGGTSLPAQASCLDIIGVRGASTNPGEHGDVLAHVIAASVLAGELSLLGAQAAGHLVESHMRLNRKVTSE
eukprot:TRINITY_DN5486_c0_g1_i1.p1 TRINITY_DN5486_c0_g1~~TRINITY_DN5486_c0_g1_i1.p1  ORF type:complete len:582 (+),score=138.68 TRINITY_DN5486_c0_g1_i1:247-1746(+)